MWANMRLMRDKIVKDYEGRDQNEKWARALVGNQAAHKLPKSWF